MSKRTQKQNRRYYLHRKLKGFVRMKARIKTMYVPYSVTPDAQQQKYLDELRSKIGYALQTEIE